MKEITRKLDKVYKESVNLDANFKSLVKHKKLLKSNRSSQEVPGKEEIIDNLPRTEFLRDLDNSYNDICESHELVKLLFRMKYISRLQFEKFEKIHKSAESIKRSIDEIENQ
jgi:hypothetical protein